MINDIIRKNTKQKTEELKKNKKWILERCVDIYMRSKYVEGSLKY